MNTPNKLTVARMILVPFLVLFMLTDLGGEANRYIALAIFVVASVTDWFDGKLARKYNLVTNFGKFMDPLADKLLVCSAMICFIELEKTSGMVCYHYYRKRIYYQWIPSDRSRERYCDRGKLLGQIQDGFPDDHDYFTSDRSGRSV